MTWQMSKEFDDVAEVSRALINKAVEACAEGEMGQIAEDAVAFLDAGYQVCDLTIVDRDGHKRLSIARLIGKRVKFSKAVRDRWSLIADVSASDRDRWRGRVVLELPDGTVHVCQEGFDFTWTFFKAEDFELCSEG